MNNQHSTDESSYNLVSANNFIFISKVAHKIFSLLSIVTHILLWIDPAHLVSYDDTSLTKEQKLNINLIEYCAGIALFFLSLAGLYAALSACGFNINIKEFLSQKRSDYPNTGPGIQAPVAAHMDTMKNTLALALEIPNPAHIKLTYADAVYSAYVPYKFFCCQDREIVFSHYFVFHKYRKNPHQPMNLQYLYDEQNLQTARFTRGVEITMAHELAHIKKHGHLYQVYPTFLYVLNLLNTLFYLGLQSGKIIAFESIMGMFDPQIIGLMASSAVIGVSNLIACFHHTRTMEMEADMTGLLDIKHDEVRYCAEQYYFNHSQQNSTVSDNPSSFFSCCLGRNLFDTHPPDEMRAAYVEAARLQHYPVLIAPTEPTAVI